MDVQKKTIIKCVINVSYMSKGSVKVEKRDLKVATDLSLVGK